MRMPALALVLALAALEQSCATTGAPPVIPTDAPLIGSWRGPVPLRAPDGACAYDLALFADGTAEVNYVDDDSLEEMCSFVRLPFTVEGDVLRLGEAATCRHRLDRDGDRDLLTIACEDRSAPPATLEGAMVMRRLVVRELRGQEAVAGRWVSGKIFDTAVSVSLDANGRGSFGNDLAQFDARDDGTATITIDGKKAACIYRATADRLTIRCADDGEPAPTSFAQQAVVFVRAP